MTQSQFDNIFHPELNAHRARQLLWFGSEDRQSWFGRMSWFWAVRWCFGSEDFDKFDMDRLVGFDRDAGCRLCSIVVWCHARELKYKLESFILVNSEKLMLTTLFVFEELHSKHRFLNWSRDELLGHLFWLLQMDVNRILCSVWFSVVSKEDIRDNLSIKVLLHGFYIRMSTDCIIWTNFFQGANISLREHQFMHVLTDVAIWTQKC